MAAKQLMLPFEIVKKSNVLCRAKWAVESVYEPRLVALVAARVHKDDKDFFNYEIPVKEILGSRVDGRAYKLLSDVTDNLMKRIILLPRDHGGFAKANIFSFCEYLPEKGVIVARFDPAMKPHYLELKEKFTQYNLMEFLTLPSTYSQRLYEVLKSWDDGRPEKVLHLTDLFETLDAPTTLQRYPDFRRFVLEKAHKDINKKTTLEYEWEPIKKGRSVQAIRFIFIHDGAKKTSNRMPLKVDPKKSKPEHSQALECWLAKRQSGKTCPIRTGEKTAGHKKCQVCLEKLPLDMDE